MDNTPDYTVWDSYIRRIFVIEDFTLGSSKEPYLIRYRGRLITPDSAQAYDQLAESLKPLGLTPLFRVEDGQHIILIEKSAPEPKTNRPMINLIMFILTLISVIASGALTDIEILPSNPFQAIWLILKTGWPFAVSLMAILGTHEFGHYLVGRAHGARVTLPFFIPLPYSAFGTMGALISMKEIPKNKRVLMDIAVAGPIAGYVVSLAVIMIGLSLSNLDRIPTALAAGHGFQIEGNSITYLLLKYLRFGQLLPQPLTYGDTSPLLYWLKYLISARPFPLGGLDVMIHPVAWAGWAGLLITSINLLPAGQLDGGHVFYLLFGKKKAARMLPIIIVILAGLGFLWAGWWIWAGIIFLFGSVYAEPRDQITELDLPRKILGIVTLIIFIVTFSPVPLTLISG